ncbi:alpha/beta hydrolase [Pelagerythrobacter sp.]|uniref:alpha/beta hydrolase n=1 Tax=Pelagerythrobacter sp. TaxID=2800702 RepID=UPI0035B3D913
MPPYELEFEWYHTAFAERARFVETYGFAGSQSTINLEGILIRPAGQPSRTLLVYMHPASTLQLLPVPRAMAAAGVHVLCAASRYARNDTAAILENILLDLGAHIRHAKERLGYERIVLAGWSGGGSLSMFYQAQATRPTIDATPAGDPVDIRGAELPKADGVIFQAAHISRARLLADAIDPSVMDEAQPDRRDIALDIYAEGGPKPPFSAEFIAAYRLAQIERIARITHRVKDTLEDLRRRGGAEMERGFVTHRTLADPRFLDSALDPNDRKPGACYLGVPETANSGPVGLARFSTLRAWLSQWSLEDTNADAVSSARSIDVPFLAIENGADDAVPQPHVRAVFDAVGTQDRRMHVVRGANHYYASQPEQMDEATTLVLDWLEDRGLR